MEETTQKIENYELGFHLLPELEEAQAKEKFKEIESLVSQLGGIIFSSKEPKKQRLSYPLKHKRYSFFGVIDFKSPAESIDSLSAQLKLNDFLLRFIVLKIKENQKVLRSLKETGSRPKIRTHTPVAAEQKPKEEIKPEVMEKEIENVLEKI